jgi:hypothetical protein
MEANVDPLPRGPDWVPITPKTGSLFHAETHYGPRWIKLWQNLYGKAMAASQQALAGMIDRTRGYDQALINERVPSRLADGSVDVEVESGLSSPFTGENIEALSIRANWLRQAEPGSIAIVVGHDAAGRTLVDVGGAKFTYGPEGLNRR